MSNIESVKKLQGTPPAAAREHLGVMEDREGWV
jgi:hypothetical protein